MSAPEPAAAGWGGGDRLRPLLRQLAAELGVTCLVEGPDGALVGHAVLGDDPGREVVSAVLRGDCAPLHAALTGQRTVAVLPGGAVRSGRVGDHPLLVVPVRSEGDLLGWWWLVGGDALPAPELVAQHCRRLEVELAAADAADEGLLAAVLDGSRVLPSTLHEAASLHAVAVAATDAPPAPGALVWALRRAVRDSAPRPAAVLVGRASGTAALLVGAAAGDVVPLVEQWLLRAGAAVGADLVAGAVPAPRTELAAALPLAVEVAGTATRAGSCRLLHEARSELVLRRAASAVLDVADLGDDPLARLVAHDDRRGSELTRTLFTWLQHHGEAQPAAQALFIHTNTLRYRVGRAQEVLGVDLARPASRLELHLRLHHLHATDRLPGRQRPLGTVAEGSTA